MAGAVFLLYNSLMARCAVSQVGRKQSAWQTAVELLLMLHYKCIQLMNRIRAMYIVITVERRISETSIIRNVKYPDPHFLRSTFKQRKISGYFTQSITVSFLLSVVFCVYCTAL